MLIPRDFLPAPLTGSPICQDLGVEGNAAIPSSLSMEAVALWLQLTEFQLQPKKWNERLLRLFQLTLESIFETIYLMHFEIIALHPLYTLVSMYQLKRLDAY